MPSCFVCSRSFNAKNQSLGISFHQIPKNEERREKWLSFIRYCGVNDANLKARSIICSQHFTIDSFNYYNKKKWLKEHAVPSIVIDRVKSAKYECSEIKFIPVDGVITNIDGVQQIDIFSGNEQPNSTNEIPVKDNKLLTCFQIQQQPIRSKKLVLENAGIVCDTDTPKEHNLKRHISTLVRENFNQKKKIKMLNQQIRRQSKKILSLKSVVKILKKKTKQIS